MRGILLFLPLESISFIGSKLISTPINIIVIIENNKLILRIISPF